LRDVCKWPQLEIPYEEERGAIMKFFKKILKALKWLVGLGDEIGPAKVPREEERVPES
jgi:hypothetical protein